MNVDLSHLFQWFHHARDIFLQTVGTHSLKCETISDMREVTTSSNQTASTTAGIKSQFIIFPDWSIGQAGEINHDILCVFVVHGTCDVYSEEPDPVGNIDLGQLFHGSIMHEKNF